MPVFGWYSDKEIRILNVAQKSQKFYIRGSFLDNANLHQALQITDNSFHKPFFLRYKRYSWQFPKMIFLCYRRYSWQFDSFWIAKSHIHNNGFCGFNSWQVEQEPVSLVHPWFTPFRLYIFRFLHQTTTSTGRSRLTWELYIFRFLHQTTTPFCEIRFALGCISFVSYIKPQPHYVF